MENKPLLKYGLRAFTFLTGVAEIELGTFAASSAFFLFLSLIPILILLCSIIPYTSLSEAELLWLLQKSIGEIAPPVISDMIRSVVETIFSGGLISLSISALATLWTASKAFLALMRGMDVIHGVGRQGWFIARLKSCFYTMVMILVLTFMLVGVVFGKRLADYFGIYSIALLSPLVWLLRQRFWLAWIILTCFFTVVYTWVPKKKLHLHQQLPGAMLAAGAWILFSAGFSVYLNHSAAFGIYGSLTTIVIALLWMYYCMYIFLLGAYRNANRTQ